MSFSADAWSRNAPAYEAIRTMAFNEELGAGTLTQERFKHYIVQDAHYLIAFSRALAIAAAKAPDPDRMIEFCEAARDAIVVERALHGNYFARWGIDAATFTATPVSPGGHHYISYLLATAFGEPYEVLLGALLPCFWIYAEVGKDILGRAAPDNPYQSWIDTYAGEEFDRSVRTMIEATDEAAEGRSVRIREAMHAAYSTATALEYQFWESAYRMERWPLSAPD